MAENIPGTDWDIGEALAVGVAKQVYERTLTPFIGNGTYMSGGIKLGLAYVIGKYGPKNFGFNRISANALTVDGVEDVAVNLVNMVMPARSEGTAQDAVIFA